MGFGIRKLIGNHLPSNPFSRHSGKVAPEPASPRNSGSIGGNGDIAARNAGARPSSAGASAMAPRNSALLSAPQRDQHEKRAQRASEDARNAYMQSHIPQGYKLTNRQLDQLQAQAHQAGRNAYMDSLRKSTQPAQTTRPAPTPAKAPVPEFQIPRANPEIKAAAAQKAQVELSKLDKLAIDVRNEMAEVQQDLAQLKKKEQQVMREFGFRSPQWDKVLDEGAHLRNLAKGLSQTMNDIDRRKHFLQPEGQREHALAAARQLKELRQVEEHESMTMISDFRTVAWKNRQSLDEAKPMLENFADLREAHKDLQEMIQNGTLEHLPPEEAKEVLLAAKMNLDEQLDKLQTLEDEHRRIGSRIQSLGGNAAILDSRPMTAAEHDAARKEELRMHQEAMDNGY